MEQNNINEISDDWIMMLTAMVKSVSHLVKCPNVNKKRREVALPFRQERKKRGLKKISIFDDLNKLKEYNKSFEITYFIKGFDFAIMSDDEVKIWFAVSSEIADFSCLGRGVRPYIMTIYQSSTEELKIRGLKSQSFYDMKM